MAMKKCKECGNEVSTKAESCPNCGAVLKKKAGCLGSIGAGILILFVLGVISSSMDDDSTDSKAKSQKIYKEREVVSVGHMVYGVTRSWWSSRLNDNQFLDDRPDAMFLFIDLVVVNDDKKPHTIPPFKLIDEHGAEYETTSKGWAIDGTIDVLDSLNPGVLKKGCIIIFDVPQSHSYKLKVSGGYWSDEDAFVKVTPKYEKVGERH